MRGEILNLLEEKLIEILTGKVRDIICETREKMVVV